MSSTFLHKAIEELWFKVVEEFVCFFFLHGDEFVFILHKKYIVLLSFPRRFLWQKRRWRGAWRRNFELFFQWRAKTGQEHKYYSWQIGGPGGGNLSVQSKTGTSPASFAAQKSIICCCLLLLGLLSPPSHSGPYSTAGFIPGLFLYSIPSW